MTGLYDATITAYMSFDETRYIIELTDRHSSNMITVSNVGFYSSQFLMLYLQVNAAPLVPGGPRELNDDDTVIIDNGGPNGIVGEFLYYRLT